MARLQDLALARKDLLYIDPRIIKRRPGWNKRTPSLELDEHIRTLAESIRAIGVQEPLKIYKEGEDLYLVAGHCRMAAVELLLAEGVEIKSVPTMVKDLRYTSEADLLLEQITGNMGRTFGPLEQGEVFKLLLGYGWNVADIAKKVGKSVTSVDEALRLCAAPEPVKAMVKEGRVAATTAAKVVKQNTPGKAVEILHKAEETAHSQGKTKVTPKHLPAAPPRPAAKPLEDLAGVRLERLLEEVGFKGSVVNALEEMRSLTKEVQAWRERFPKFRYRHIDECVERVAEG
jgi:ParB/RepB/Spo0J family partition protein